MDKCKWLKSLLVKLEIQQTANCISSKLNGNGAEVDAFHRQ
jgi:hypothetical protein